MSDETCTPTSNLDLIAQLREDIGDGAVVLLVGDGHRYDPLRLKAADEIERLIAERDAALARFALLTTEIARLERQLIAEQDHDELLIKAHERLLQLRPGWPEADHGDRAAIETVTTVPCAGCVLGLPKGEDGVHYNPFNGTPHKCTAVEIVVRA